MFLKILRIFLSEIVEKFLVWCFFNSTHILFDKFDFNLYHEKNISKYLATSE